MSPRVWIAAAALLLIAVPSAGAAGMNSKEKEKERAELAKAGTLFAPERISHRAVTRDEALANGLTEAELPDASVMAAGAFAVRPAAAGGCWQQSWHHHAGLWPYDRHIWQQTTWCSSGSAITSRSSSGWPGTGPACRPNWGPSTWRAGGGAGYSSVDVSTRGGFSCNITPLGDLQFWLWMTIRYYPGGTSAVAGYGY